MCSIFFVRSTSKHATQQPDGLQTSSSINRPLRFCQMCTEDGTLVSGLQLVGHVCRLHAPPRLAGAEGPASRRHVKTSDVQQHALQ